MKKYLMLILLSLTAINAAAYCDVQQYLNSISTHFLLEPRTDVEFLSVIDGFLQNVENPYAKHAVQIGPFRIYMTLLDLVMFVKLDEEKGVEERNKSNECGLFDECGQFDYETYRKNLNCFITLLKERGFEQTISNEQFNQLGIKTNTIPSCNICIAEWLRSEGLEVEVDQQDSLDTPHLCWYRQLKQL